MSFNKLIGANMSFKKQIFFIDYSNEENALCAIRKIMSMLPINTKAHSLLSSNVFVGKDQASYPNYTIVKVTPELITTYINDVAMEDTSSSLNTVVFIVGTIGLLESVIDGCNGYVTTEVSPVNIGFIEVAVTDLSRIYMRTLERAEVTKDDITEMVDYKLLPTGDVELYVSTLSGKFLSAQAVNAPRPLNRLQTVTNTMIAEMMDTVDTIGCKVVPKDGCVLYNKKYLGHKLLISK